MSNYGSAQADATALLTLLRAQAALVSPPFAVYPDVAGGPSTVPPGAMPPYVSVHFATENSDGGRLDLRSTRTRTRAYAHCVGANDIAARAMVDQVAVAWLDVRPVIAGRTCDPIRHEQTREADVTEPVAQTTVTLTAVYRFETGPA